MKQGPAKLSVEVPYFYLKLKYWWYGFLALVLVLLALTLGGLGSPSWVRADNSGMTVHGGLLRCTTCPHEWAGRNYGDIADDICGNDTLDFYCDAFENLSTAGGCYIGFDVVAVVALLGWLLKLVMYLKETDFLGRRVWIGYVFPGVFALCHILALIIWSSVSVASFSSDCDESSDICSGHGPGLSLAVSIIGPLAAGGFAFIYYHVKREETNLLSPPHQSSFGPRQPAFVASQLNESNKEVEGNRA